MDLVLGLIFFVLLLLVVGVVLPRIFQTRMTCNRCDGSGEVHEDWPDPSEPDGFHRLDGQCPKCKGTGKVRV